MKQKNILAEETVKKNESTYRHEKNNNGLNQSHFGIQVNEIGGPTGPEPTRYGDWEKCGRCIDF